MDTSPSPVSWSSMCKQLFGFIGFMLFMFYVGEKLPSYRPVVSTDNCYDFFCYFVLFSGYVKWLNQLTNNFGKDRISAFSSPL